MARGSASSWWATTTPPPPAGWSGQWTNP